VIAARSSGTSFTEFSNCVVPVKLAGGSKYGRSDPSTGAMGHRSDPRR
jgi:hypothetical protein